MIKKMITLVLLPVLLAGCSNGGPKQTGGTLLGGLAGAAVGSQFGKGHGRLAAVGIGSVLGAMVGGSIGAKMDEKDKQLAQQTAMNALEHQPNNQVSSWNNPNNNHHGSFVVTKTDDSPSSRLVCRDYVQSVIIDGREETVHGRACRDKYDSRGTWEIQKA